MTRWRRFLLLIALLMRVAVPSGFMIDAGHAATPALVACDGSGPLFKAAAGHHHQGTSHQGTAAHGDYPFAGTGSLSHTATPAAPSAIPLARQFLAPAVPPLRHRPHSTAPPPPSTGPPATA